MVEILSSGKKLWFQALQQVPIPRDIELPLPLPDADLKILLVVFFLIHILFVNLTVIQTSETLHAH